MTENKMQIVLPVLLIALFLTACAQNQAQNQSSDNKTLPANETKKAEPASNAEIWLIESRAGINYHDMGTTGDLSILSDKLESVFEERREMGVFRENSSDVEKTVFIDAEPGLKVSEVAKVINKLEESGASPIMLFLKTVDSNSEVEHLKKQNKNNSAESVKRSILNPLNLIVTIGKRRNQMSSNPQGIAIDLHQTSVSRKELVPPITGFDVVLGKDGEYVVEGKIVSSSALKDEINTYFRDYRNDPALKTTTVYLENNAETISFATILEIAKDAYDAKSSELILEIYQPER